MSEPFQTFEPVTCMIRLDLINQAIICIEEGLEDTRECLSNHDVSLGRATSKNRRMAEFYEDQIRKAELTIELLKAERPG